MSYLALIGLAFLAASKAAIQGLFAKKMKNLSDNFLFNTLIFIAIVIVFSLIFGIHMPSPMTLVCAAVFGVASVVFQFAYTNALKHGSVALTVFINSFHLVFPIALCAALYNEIPHMSQYIGLIFLIISLYLIILKKDNNGKENSNINKIWGISVACCTLCAGCTVSSQKIHQYSAFKSEYSQFIVFAYIIAAVCSGMVFLYLKLVKREDNNIKFDLKTVGFAGLIGIILGIYNSGTLYFSGVFASVVLTPIVNISSILWSTIYGVLVFHERMTKNQCIGFVAGIVSILLITT